MPAFKDISKQAAKVGWTAALIVESVNSAARMEAHSRKFNRGHHNQNPAKPIAAVEMTTAAAEHFLSLGEPPNGEIFDVFERWVERRTGFSNTSGLAFDPPTPSQSLMKALPPIIVSDKTELAQDIISFHDVTNERAQQRLLGK